MELKSEIFQNSALKLPNVKVFTKDENKLVLYFNLPNNHAGWNKRTGGKICQILTILGNQKWSRVNSNFFNDNTGQKKA